MSTISGIVGAITQKKASKRATEAQQETGQAAIDAQMKMFNLTREDFAPFQAAGVSALGELRQGSNQAINYSTNEKLGDWVIVGNADLEQLKAAGVKEWQWATDRPDLGYTSGIFVSPAELDKIDDYNYQQTREGQAVTGLESLEFGGNSQKYIDLLDELDFKLDPEDEIYKWRQKKTEETINRFQAGRGTWNSRAAMNALVDSNMALQADEIGRQFQQNYLRKSDKYKTLAEMTNALDVNEFQREYTRLLDLYNTGRLEDETDYNRLLDMVKIGTGASAATGSAAMGTGQGVASSLTNMGTAQGMNALRQGAIGAQFMQGMQQLPTNALLSYGYGKDAGLWGQPTVNPQPAWGAGAGYGAGAGGAGQSAGYR